MLTLLLLACTNPSPMDTSKSDDTGGAPDSSDSGDTAPRDVVSVAGTGLPVPTDAAPSADGSTFYVITEDDGLYSMPADGSQPPTLIDGSLRGAAGLLLSLDGSEVFVSAHTDEDDERIMHAIHLDGSGDIPHLDTAGLEPGGFTGMLPPSKASHNEYVYFTGRTRSAGVAEGGAVYSFPPHAQPALIATGFGGGLPEAIEAAPDRSLYVSVVDGDVGSVWHIPADVVAQDGAADPSSAATLLLEGYIPGDTPGIALTADGGTLLISSLSASGTSQVVLLTLASGETTVFDDVIRENSRSGGVHRARDVDVFAWADLNSPGSVYRVDLR